MACCHGDHHHCLVTRDLWMQDLDNFSKKSTHMTVKLCEMFANHLEFYTFVKKKKMEKKRS